MVFHQNWIHFSDIKRLEKPIIVGREGLEFDLLSSKPTNTDQTWGKDEDYDVVTYGETAVDEFITKYKLDVIVRSNGLVKDGYNFEITYVLLSIFSVPEFNNNDNKGAVLKVDENLFVTFSIFEKSQENQVEKKKQILNEANNDGEIKLVQKEFKFLDKEEIDSYNTKKKIGSGATSTVYKVKKENDETYYALKVFNSDLLSQSAADNEDGNDDDDKDDDKFDTILFKMFQRFLTEYELLNSIDHPYIVKTLGFFYGDKKHPPCILLEYCPNNLLNSIKSLTGVDQIRIIYQLCKVIDFIHRAGLIHRDIKPNNILIDANKNIKLCDFGIAKIMSVDSQTETMTHGIGTPHFMAPELFESDSIYDNKVDVYAFGIVLYFILTKGQLPKLSIADIIKMKQISVPSTVNSFSKNLILKCTSYYPKDRPSFNSILKDIEQNNFKLIDNVNFDPFKM